MMWRYITFVISIVNFLWCIVLYCGTVEPARRSFSGTNWFGHALARYQWSPADVRTETQIGEDPTSLPSHHIQSCDKATVATDGHWSCSVHDTTLEPFIFDMDCDIIRHDMICDNSMILWWILLVLKVHKWWTSYQLKIICLAPVVHT